MTLAYFDCFSGISGDMLLGALVDAGVPIETLRAELEKLRLPGYEITALKVTRGGIAATKVHVCLEEKEQPARHLSGIRSLIEASSLSASVKRRSISIFERLADAEAKIHGTTPDRVHFHEVGAVDAIVDIVGSVIGLELLGITAVGCSAINTGSGTVETGHGRLPVPAPATAELLQGIPFYGSSTPFELTTPTGAVIMRSLATSFGPMPQMRVDRVAYGAGGREIAGTPNVLRVMVGEPESAYQQDHAIVIETNIDDMNPQGYDYLIERLLDKGALDAYLTPVIMKKGRPAVLLTVLTEHEKSRGLLDIIFRESTSIGVRMHDVDRRKLERELREVETPYGTVSVKIGKQGNEILNVMPEYEDCRRLAVAASVPLKTVMQEAIRAVFKERV